MPPPLTFLHECLALTQVLRLAMLALYELSHLPSSTTAWHGRGFSRRDHRDTVPYVPVPSLIFTCLVFEAEILTLSFPDLKLSSQVTFQMPPKGKVMGLLVASGGKPFALKRSQAVKS